jgi:hypothetical protein
MSTANCVSCERIELDADNNRDTTIVVNLPCCEPVAFSWTRRDTTDAHAFDEYCMWDDGEVWDDSVKIYDNPTFSVIITCIPLGLPACYYSTADGLAYTTTNYNLYAACDADGS